MKRGVLACILAFCFFSSGCLGPNNAFNRVHYWNEHVSENKWCNEAIFLAFTIFPVYGLAYFGDIVIFNSIEFWGGRNPIEPPLKGE